MFLILFYNTSFSQYKIDQLRNEISDINISFHHSKLQDQNKYTDLENLLKYSYTDEYSGFVTSKLKTEYDLFMSSLKHVENIDTLKKIFLAVNNKFNSLSYNYFYQKALKASKQKILVFSTSMSCECTLDMCYHQEAEIQKFCKENNFDYAIIDTWEDFEIQQKYKVDFVPTVIILDSENKEIHRFTREENIYSELNRYLLEN